MKGGMEGGGATVGSITVFLLSYVCLLCVVWGATLQVKGARNSSSTWHGH